MALIPRQTNRQPQRPAPALQTNEYLQRDIRYRSELPDVQQSLQRATARMQEISASGAARGKGESDAKLEGRGLRVTQSRLNERVTRFNDLFERTRQSALSNEVIRDEYNFRRQKFGLGAADKFLNQEADILLGDPAVKGLASFGSAQRRAAPADTAAFRRAQRTGLSPAAQSGGKTDLKAGRKTDLGGLVGGAGIGTGSNSSTLKI